jgi:predicted metal-dependent hydrolase
MIGNLIQLAFDWLDGQTSHETTPLADEKISGRHQIALNGQAISYHFERSKRRSIGFIIGKHGLTVRAPRWTPMHEVETAIIEKSSWILKQLHAMHERHAHSAQAAIVWRDGACMDYLGEPLTLSLGAMVTTIDTEQRRIWVALPSTASETQIQDTVQAAIGRAALLLFEARLKHYAPLLGVHWTGLKLSNAGGRWGSAKSDGTIRLNWRLMHYRLPVIDYVVVHELSHLRHMDHSPRFWDTVESIMPDYAKLKKELKP